MITKSNPSETLLIILLMIMLFSLLLARLDQPTVDSDTSAGKGYHSENSITGNLGSMGDEQGKFRKRSKAEGRPSSYK